jgi:hypothetical protein
MESDTLTETALFVLNLVSWHALNLGGLESMQRGQRHAVTIAPEAGQTIAGCHVRMVTGGRSGLHRAG